LRTVSSFSFPGLRPGLRFGAIAIVLLLAVALDLRRAPSEQWTTAAAVGGIHLYQATLSPIYGRMGVQCRFTQTCSHYGEEAIKKYGVAKGGYLASKRILRCGPWTAPGAVDPVP
jgi:putative membrane protein insertion efficiency factor